MRLYIAGRAPNSVKAVANLEAICRRNTSKTDTGLEIVDVCRTSAARARRRHPRDPQPRRSVAIAGRQCHRQSSDTSSVLAALGLHTGADNVIDAAGLHRSAAGARRRRRLHSGPGFASVGDGHRRTRSVRCGRDRRRHGSRQRRRRPAAEARRRAARSSRIALSALDALPGKLCVLDVARCRRVWLTRHGASPGRCLGAPASMYGRAKISSLPAATHPKASAHTRMSWPRGCEGTCRPATVVALPICSAPLPVAAVKSR